MGTARNVLLIQRLIFLEMKCSLTQNSTLITGHRDKMGRKRGALGFKQPRYNTQRRYDSFSRAFRVNVPLQPSRGSDVGESVVNESERKKKRKAHEDRWQV